MKSILLIKMYLGLVEMTFGLVYASFRLPEWRALKMTFFAPYLFSKQSCLVPVRRFLTPFRSIHFVEYPRHLCLDHVPLALSWSYGREHILPVPWPIRVSNVLYNTSPCPFPKRRISFFFIPSYRGSTVIVSMVNKPKNTYCLAIYPGNVKEVDRRNSKRSRDLFARNQDEYPQQYGA